MSSGSASYLETVERLRVELTNHVAALKSTAQWSAVEKLWGAICALQDLAGMPRMSVEELFALAPVDGQQPALQPTGKGAGLALGPQEEPEAATELEKGS
jgi:hypothetical protein